MTKEELIEKLLGAKDAEEIEEFCRKAGMNIPMDKVKEMLDKLRSKCDLSDSSLADVSGGRGGFGFISTDDGRDILEEYLGDGDEEILKKWGI